MPTSDEEYGVLRLHCEYFALPDQVLTDYERLIARDLLAQNELTITHTLIGPCYTLHPCAVSGTWSVHGPGTVTDAASSATLRLWLEAQGGAIGRYQVKGQSELASPGERWGVPTAMTMQVPGTLLGLTQARVPALVVSTISGGGISRGRARDLLQTHRLLKDGAYHLIVGTLDPRCLKRLEKHQGPKGQRALVLRLPFQDDHAR
ncbi:hypothetical protein [Deinococcus sonorensis]|uniref:Uncharacterized protein n=2 Tax=Deinococcus sonorensis TaxID=309891 RepID=A0AAU7UGP9_9DEIO